MNELFSFPRARLEVLQVNLGYKCNQQCIHCHLDANPYRTEIMDRSVMKEIISFLIQSEIKIIDLTGGAPELHPHFRDFVRELRGLNLHVIDRCNLTILNEPGNEDLIDFFAKYQIELYASLPCYLKENVEAQRGPGVFESSIITLKKLNQIGYGEKDSGLILNLVYNPLGPFLPPPQELLEGEYKKYLRERYGITFNHLFTITNMPIGRFHDLLISQGEKSRYLQLLMENHRQENLDSVMCRTLISVDWRGYLYDCDFNQALGLPIRFKNQSPIYIAELKGLTLEGNPIPFRPHCYGCTAGQGSSCTGALNKGFINLLKNENFNYYSCFK